MDEWQLIASLRAVWAWRRHPDLGGYGPGWCDETYLRRLRSWGYTEDEISLLATAGAAGNTIDGYRRFGIVDAATIAECQALGLGWLDAGHFHQAGIEDPEEMHALRTVVSGEEYHRFRDAGVLDVDEMTRAAGDTDGSGTTPATAPAPAPVVVVVPTPEYERTRVWSGRPRPPRPFTDAHDAHCSAIQLIVEHNADEAERDAAIELLQWVDGGWTDDEREEFRRLGIDGWTAWQFAACDIRAPGSIAALVRSGFQPGTALRWGERGVTGVESLILAIAAAPDDGLVTQLLPEARRRNPHAALPDGFELDVGALVAAQAELVLRRLLDPQ